MRVTDFDFDLPPELIAQHPPAERGDSRMMTVDRTSGALADRHFRDFPSMLRPGDLLVMNDSRVIPARLFARRAGLRTQHNSPAPTGHVEVLLTQPLGEGRWRALVKPGRKVPVGERLLFEQASESGAPHLASETQDRQPAAHLEADVIEAGDFGERTLQFAPAADFFGTLDRLGHMPLPPYIRRSDDEPEDRDRYQTVYAGADTHGSAAAPTAGLHFTPEILQQIKQRGVETAHVTLHVGLGTFQPVRADTLADIRLHEEHYTLPGVTADAILRAKAEGRRIVSVGTTTTRTLEHVAATNQVHAHSGSTSIFLQPGHRFALVDALLTNFHLPKSTLLMLVSAFAGTGGREKVLAAYEHAVHKHYRFFSYGDCMFLS
ncbi:tRNA preQ1(34) S-adenosylmethionine ribosyltransferase-isomerase QueA [Terriglobus roseus]|uniref:S-adenosylmethionine:tRNA ribosyltransferase-isomerase n=1 Tax=Terriglobus roseus TaxID=392734 RepID=A0A1H4T9P9_9BACT|nr:tRNA preQ1(34) S-adenosylmethionine ribosyltransferase-isomerase QueA [Terriglobus roseus]SEC53152.1 S-adenosylmethionine:tRNA ribosyltransferase-isomerase [Terriglobus roseus]